MNNQNNVSNYDANGYILNGKPEWLASGEFQYFRMKKEDWEPRLLQLKLAGFNTVSVYFPWNFHEVEEGVWDFTGDKDAEYFLAVAAKLGLYVVARPGPFICNEWTNGGIPAWLSGKEGVRLRTADPLYLSYCDKWLNHIVPMLARYQLGKEGTVILVQVENEYGHLGMHQEENYIYHLRDGLRERGITVPIINCDSFIKFDRIKPHKWKGINLCCNAGGDGLRVLDRARDLQPEAPLFVTEFWIAAFDWWGRFESAVYGNDRALYGALEMVAGGASGLTVFVFSGGASFGYWHGQSICSDANFMTTLYGPGAPILDDGRLSEKYYLFKTHFTGLMAASEKLAKAGMPEISGDINKLCTAVRRSDDTVFRFFINHSKEQMLIADQQKEQGAVDMSIPAGEVQWSVENLPLKSGLLYKKSNGSIFAGDPVLVIYGEHGKRLEVFISAEGLTGDINVDPVYGKVVGREIIISGIPSKDGEPLLCNIKVGSVNQPVIILSDEAVRKWYRVDLPGMNPVIVGGIDRIDKADVMDNKLSLRYYTKVSTQKWKYDQNGFGNWNTVEYAKDENVILHLSDIRMYNSFPESELDYDDSKWFQAEYPQPMAKFGSGNGKAWYRTIIDVEQEGWQMIHVSGASDRWMFFVDGQYLSTRGVATHKGRDCAIYMTAGRHCMSILVENLGMYNTGFEMDIPMGEPKGIYGPVWRNGIEIRDWKMREGLQKGENNDYWPAAFDIKWKDSITAFIDGPCYIKGTIPYQPNNDGAVRIDTKGVKGSIWVNGHNIGRYWNLGPQKSLWIPNSILKEKNELIIFEEEKISPELIEIEYIPFGIKGYGDLNV